jgi:hypothetical protein
MLWEIVPDVLRDWSRASFDAIMLPRVAYYVFTVAAAPFGVLCLLSGSPPGRPSPLPLAIWLGLSALGGAIFITLVVLMHS